MIGSNIPNPPLTDETGKRIAEAIENISGGGGGGEELDTIEVEFFGSTYLNDLTAPELTSAKYTEVVNALLNRTARVIGVLHVTENEPYGTTYTSTDVQVFSNDDPTNPLIEGIAFHWLGPGMRYTVQVTRNEGSNPFSIGSFEVALGHELLVFEVFEGVLECYMGGPALSKLITAMDALAIGAVDAILYNEEGAHFSRTVTITWSWAPDDGDTLNNVLHCFFLDGNGDTIHVIAWLHNGEVACEIVTPNTEGE